MSTPTIQRTTSVRHPQRVRFVDILRSEFIKLTSLRVTSMLLGAMLVFGIGVSVLFAMTAEQGGIPSAPSTGYSLDAITIGTVLFSQIIAGVLGVLAITTEYSSGTIQPTLAAVPHRGRVLAAKALVVFPLTMLTACVSLFGSWALTYPIYAGLGIATGLLAPGFVFALMGGAVYVGVCAVVGLGFGTLLRSAAGGSIAVVCTMLLVPVLISVLPTSEAIRTIRVYMLSHAGDSMVRLGDPALGFANIAEGYLSPVGGWVTVFVWAVVAFVAGTIVLRKRDA